jgi:hypothetical protein
MGLTDYRGIHAGETAWVIGSGSSLNHIDASFFDDKLCVCVNFSGVSKGLQRFYSVSHHHNDADQIAQMRPDLTVFTTEVEQLPSEDRSAHPAREPNVIKCPTIDQRYAAFNPFDHWPEDPDTLIVGPSSVHMTMHLAAYMGAAHIVMVGADCGEFDGASRVTDYEHPDGLLHFDVWRNALESMAGKLRSLGVSVHSINPWVTPTLEGHKYRSGSLHIN